MKAMRLVWTVAVLAAAGGVLDAGAQVVTYPLPDPLQMQNGTPVTTVEQWQNQRRPELLNLFKQQIYGTTRIGNRSSIIRYVVREETPDARNGRATRLRVAVLFEGTEEGRQMELLVYLPNNVNGPVPMFLGLNFDGNFSTTTEPDVPVAADWVYGLFYKAPNHLATEALRGYNAGMWPYDTILDRGYGIATAHYTDIEPDMVNQWWHGPHAWSGEPTGGSDWGAFGAWAWGLSRAMDWMQTEPRIDSSKVAVLGFSRLGKTAMWAGAQDQRFAAVVSQCSGKGGVSLSKRITGEPVSNLVTKYGYWFAPNYAQYSGNEEAMPVDGHELAALIAPRPLLILSGRADSWSDPEGEFLSGVHATPVYELLGSDGLATTNWPSPGTLINSPIGYYMHTTGHDVTTDDWTATLNWADAYLNPFDGYYEVKVSSGHGNPQPATGVNPFLKGSVVTCSVPYSVAAAGTNFVCTGWTGTGDIPAAGLSNTTGPITLTQDSSITWKWEIDQMILIVENEGRGTCNPLTGWYPLDSEQTLVATPDEGWLFTGWTGTIEGDYTTSSTNLVIDSPKRISAVFSDDADGDGILNRDETAYGTSPRKADTDGDGINDHDEIFVYATNPKKADSDSDGLMDGTELLVYGTDPNVKDSDQDGFDDGFEVSTGYNPALDSDTPDLFSLIKPAIELQFYSTDQVRYRIEATDSLTNTWGTIESDILNEGPVVKRLYSVDGPSNRYFRVRFD